MNGFSFFGRNVAEKAGNQMMLY